LGVNDNPCQTMVFTLRRAITHVANTWYDLYHYTTTAQQIIPINAAWNVFIQIVGLTANAAKKWAYNIEGAVVNDGGTTSILYQNVTTLYESDNTYDVQLAIYSFLTDGMKIQVRTTDSTDNVYWFARMQVAQVTSKN
jgi:hypothetical protein